MSRYAHNVRYHLTVDGFDCDTEKLSSMDLVFDVLKELPEKVNMKPWTVPYVVKGAETNPGYSGFIIIEQSHISIHTFSAENYVAIDLFSCKNFDKDWVLNYLKEKFGFKDAQVHFLAPSPPSEETGREEGQI